jgi:hypothetical protein|uniref:Uncharacterized protein n=1 Tax=Zea mays TaxID=4577 RepID=A0A804NET3_MAIZE
MPRSGTRTAPSATYVEPSRIAPLYCILYAGQPVIYKAREESERGTPPAQACPRRRPAAVQSPLPCMRGAIEIQLAIGFSRFAVVRSTQRRSPGGGEMELVVVRSRQGRRGARGLGRAVKEQGARLRIICRCVALLVFYRD